MNHQINAAFSIDEFCQRYGLGKTKAYGEIRAGRLPARKAGTRTLILSDDAARWASRLPMLDAGKPG